MKNYVIIGGSSGIGRSVVEKLTAKGHRVWATFFSKDMTHHETPNVSYHYMDVTQEELDFSWLPNEVNGFVYAPGAIDLLPFGRMKMEKLNRDFQLQVMGAVKSLQLVMPKMKRAENPSIVLYSTVAVQMGFNFHSQVAISKGAIEGLTRSLAAEFAPKVRINAIAPSITKTPLAEKFLSSEAKVEANAQRHPLKRIGEASDIANATLFLLSEESHWMTGQIINVDGGMSRIKL
ncbi:MAG: SDR family NAD(P)-dependent oxidoreductase [Salibacteraceae bacterium]